jgi:RNA polymerase sigma factor (sigma-70 family)
MNHSDSDTNDKSDINEAAAQEELIREAVEGQPTALELLLFSTWLTNLLQQIATWVTRQFHVDGEEARDFVFDKLRTNIQNITNSGDNSWRDVVTRWCYAVARNYALNILRHLEVEQRHRATVTHEHTQHIVHGTRIVEPCATTLTPQEELERQEQTRAEHAFRLKLRQALHPVVRSFTAEDVKILQLWAEGKKLREIATLTGIPLATVARRLKKLQKALYEEGQKMVDKELGPELAEELGVGPLLIALLTNRASVLSLLTDSI